MPAYLISYDLRKPGRNYEALYSAIKAYGTWAHIHESVWAIVTEEPATTIRDGLLIHMDEDDRLLVLKSGVEAAWRGIICKSEWLKQNL
jgi:hypothetical protein